MVCDLESGFAAASWRANHTHEPAQPQTASLFRLCRDTAAGALAATAAAQAGAAAAAATAAKRQHSITAAIALPLPPEALHSGQHLWSQNMTFGLLRAPDGFQ